MPNPLSKKNDSMGSQTYLETTRHLLTRVIQTLTKNSMLLEVLESGGLLACVAVRS